MKALCWRGTGNVHLDDVPEPKILNPQDAIIQVTTTAICGSDLHLLNGVIPTMERGDILGHEFMGRVVAIGSSVHNLKLGDRVVVPFTIACGNCFYCKRQLWSLCDNSNPNAAMAEKVNGYSGSALFGYSHMYGGYAGGQAEYVRVPFADVGPIKVPDELDDERVLFLSDILPAGYMAALNCNIHQGDTIAVWGCGPVGLMTIKSAFLIGAERVIAIDHIPSRLKMAQEVCGAEVLNFEKTDVLESLNEMTGRRGPDACVDAVGLEDHGCGFASYYDRFKMSTVSFSARPRNIERESGSIVCDVNVGRNGRLLSIAGAFGLVSLSAKRKPLTQLLCLAISGGLLYRGLTGKCKLYDVIGANTAYSHSHPNAAVRNKNCVHVIEAMTILQPVELVYGVWRDFTQLPKYLRHLESVQILDDQRSRWKIKSSVGELEWDAAIIEDKVNKVISWKTSGNAEVSSAGSVVRRFTPLSAQGGTEIVVNLRYDTVGDRWISWFTSLLRGSAENMIREDLRRFKQVLETGEVAATSGQPTGR